TNALRLASSLMGDGGGLGSHALGLAHVAAMEPLGLAVPLTGSRSVHSPIGRCWASSPTYSDKRRCAPRSGGRLSRPYRPQGPQRVRTAPRCVRCSRWRRAASRCHRLLEVAGSEGNGFALAGFASLFRDRAVVWASDEGSSPCECRPPS